MILNVIYKLDFCLYTSFKLNYRSEERLKFKLTSAFLFAHSIFGGSNMFIINTIRLYLLIYIFSRIIFICRIHTK